MDRDTENDTSEAMTRWIKSIRKYMSDNAQVQETLPLKIPRKSEEMRRPAEFVTISLPLCEPRR